jgi:cytochrome c
MTMGMARSPADTVAQGLLLLGAMVTTGLAQASPELAKQRMCMGCHTVERKLVGPAFRDVAKRYAGKPEVAAMLAEKVIKGGKGAWGPVPMAANPRVSPAEAQQLVTWVLSLK